MKKIKKEMTKLTTVDPQYLQEIGSRNPFGYQSPWMLKFIIQNDIVQSALYPQYLFSQTSSSSQKFFFI